MDRLTPELDRLFGLRPGSPEAPTAGLLRVAVLSVVLPAGWESLAAVWRGVQSDLELPAPAIAVSGLDALQLWFGFASPVAPAAAARFLAGLRTRYLPELPAAQVRLHHAAGAEFPQPPGREVASQRWSAFVSHDLAAVFAETPWLDIPPGDEGQAALLRALEPVDPRAFEAASIRLGVGAQTTALVQTPASDAEGADPRSSGAASFLAGVMSDAGAPLALRVEAARILLEHAGR